MMPKRKQRRTAMNPLLLTHFKSDSLPSLLCELELLDPTVLSRCDHIVRYKTHQLRVQYFDAIVQDFEALPRESV